MNRDTETFLWGEDPVSLKSLCNLISISKATECGAAISVDYSIIFTFVNFWFDIHFFLKILHVKENDFLDKSHLKTQIPLTSK